MNRHTESEMFCAAIFVKFVLFEILIDIEDLQGNATLWRNDTTVYGTVFRHEQ